MSYMDLGSNIDEEISKETAIVTAEVGTIEIFTLNKHVSSSPRLSIQKYGWNYFLLGLANRTHYASQSQTG
jgi:hypothetical protein